MFSAQIYRSTQCSINNKIIRLAITKIIQIQHGTGVNLEKNEKLG